MADYIYNVSKNDAADTWNVLDQQLRLPVIDGHCHIFGQAALRGEHLHPGAKLGHVVVLNRNAPHEEVVLTASVRARCYRNGHLEEVVLSGLDVVEVAGEDWPPRLEYSNSPNGALATLDVAEVPQREWPAAAFAGVLLLEGRCTIYDADDIDEYSRIYENLRWKLLRKDMHNFGAYAAGNEEVSANAALYGIPDNNRGRVITPLVVDFGYTPQEAGAISVGLSFNNRLKTRKGRRIDCGREQSDAAMVDYYPAPEGYLWYDKRDLRWLIERHAEVAAKRPGEIWPFVPFDPRRARDKEMSTVDGRSALKVVRWAIEERGCVGIKFYSRCGWMPMGNAEIYDSAVGGELDTALTGLYQYAAEEGLPIMSHTSPVGFPPTRGQSGSTPTGMLVLPKRYYENDDRGFAPFVPDPLSMGMPFVYAECCEAVRRAMNGAYNYCHYVQKTASPYSWVEVLIDHPTLRVCLAHSGTQRAMLARYEAELANDDLQSQWEDCWREPGGTGMEELWEAGVETGKPHLITSLVKMPVAADGKLFASRYFPRLVAKYACDIVKERLDGSSEGFAPVLRIVDQVLGSRDQPKMADLEHPPDKPWARQAREAWKPVMTQWEADYPHDWLTQIVRMMGNAPNLYCDLSYLSDESEPVFDELLRRVVTAAVFSTPYEGGVIGQLPSVSAADTEDCPHLHWPRRMFIGTDWYMLEQEGITAGAFWDRMIKVIHPCSLLFERWATTNCLDYLNLKKRIPMMERFYQGHSEKPLPPWWPDLAEYYEQKKGSSGAASGG